MKKYDMSFLALMAEAVGIVSAFLYVGLQIYYGVVYGVNMINIIMNIVAMILVYTGMTLLTIYPERVNGLTREVCSGDIRKYTCRMVRIAKLIFVEGLLFACICDVLGEEINSGYSMVIVVAIVVTAVYYECRIIKILRERYKK